MWVRTGHLKVGAVGVIEWEKVGDQGYLSCNLNINPGLGSALWGGSCFSGEGGLGLFVFFKWTLKTSVLVFLTYGPGYGIRPAPSNLRTLSCP